MKEISQASLSLSLCFYYDALRMMFLNEFWIVFLICFILLHGNKTARAPQEWFGEVQYYWNMSPGFLTAYL